MEVESLSKSSSSIFTSVEVQGVLPADHSKNILHEPQSTSVIPKDVVVRLTSVEPDNREQSGMSSLFESERHVEESSGMWVG